MNEDADRVAGAESVLAYGEEAADTDEFLDYGVDASTMPGSAEVVFAAMGVPDGRRRVIELAFQVADHFYPDLSPSLRQLGEDFILGIFAHKLLKMRTQSGLGLPDGDEFTTGDLST